MQSIHHAGGSKPLQQSALPLELCPAPTMTTDPESTSNYLPNMHIDLWSLTMIEHYAMIISTL